MKKIIITAGGTSEKIDNELYASIYGKPRRGNFEEIWNRN